MPKPRSLALVLALFALLGNSSVHAGADLVQAESLIRAGKAEEAWTLLFPLEFDLAGEVDFDYLLGVAALDSGRPGQATLAFERVLAVNPNYAAARLDMARAHFAMGDHARARLEFNAVLNFDPPPPARATIERYLAAMAAGGTAPSSRLAGYLETGVGYDSNLNAGASGGSFYFPLFSATIASTSKGAAYATLAAGADMTRTVGENVDVLAGVDFRQRNNSQDWVDARRVRRTDYYDSRSIEGRLGLEFRPGPRDALRLTLSRGQYDLNLNEHYRRSGGALAEWRRSVDGGHQWSAYLAEQRLRYGSVGGASYRMYGGDQLLAGLGGVVAIEPERAAAVFAGLYGGTERATDKSYGNLDGDKRLAGVKLGGQLGLWPALLLQASVNVLDTSYEMANPLFGEQRRDLQSDLALAAQWRFAKDWQLKPQYQYTRVDSNFGVYDYRRHDISLTVRHDWR